MGMLTDVFIAKPTEATTYDGSSGGRFRRIQLARMASLEFELLWAILEGKPWEPGRHTLESVVDKESEWTFRFPTVAVELLCALDADTIVTTANLWGACEELSCPGSDVEPILRDLRDLAHAARLTHADLFLWVSL